MQPITIELDHQPAASKRRVSVREACFADYCAVVALMQRYGMETKSRSDWEHLWTENPVYQRRGGDWPIGWILENEAGQVVGFAGNIPVDYELAGTRLTAGVTHAWVVDSDYRRYSMILASKYFAQKQVDLLLNSTAIYEAGQIFRAFHAEPIPAEALDSSLFWVIRYREFMRSALVRKAIPLANLWSYPAAALMALATEIKRKPNSGSVPVLTVANRFGDEFDVLWNRLRERATSIIAVRDRASLEWHFRSSLLSGKLWIYTYGSHGELIGYALFQREDKPELGLTRVRLVDFQSLDEDPLILEAAVAAARQRCRSEGIDMLEVVGFAGRIRSKLEEMAPFRRKLPSSLFYYKAVLKELKSLLARPQLWQPCCYDGDSSL